jgi:hypothetical protein
MGHDCAADYRLIEFAEQLRWMEASGATLWAAKAARYREAQPAPS